MGVPLVEILNMSTNHSNLVGGIGIHPIHKPSNVPITHHALCTFLIFPRPRALPWPRCIGGNSLVEMAVYTDEQHKSRTPVALKFCASEEAADNNIRILNLLDPSSVAALVPVALPHGHSMTIGGAGTGQYSSCHFVDGLKGSPRHTGFSHVLVMQRGDCTLQEILGQHRQVTSNGGIGPL